MRYLVYSEEQNAVSGVNGYGDLFYLSPSILDGYLIYFDTEEEAFKKIEERKTVRAARGWEEERLVVKTEEEIRAILDLPPPKKCPQCRFFNREKGGICGEGKDMEVVGHSCSVYQEKTEMDSFITESIHKKTCRRWTEEEDKRIQALLAEKQEVIDRLKQIDKDINRLTGLRYDEQEQYQYWITKNGDRIAYPELTDTHLLNILKMLVRQDSEREITVRWFKIKEEFLMRWEMTRIGYVDSEGNQKTVGEWLQIMLSVKTNDSTWKVFCNLIRDEIKKREGEDKIEVIRNQVLVDTSKLEKEITDTISQYQKITDKAKTDIAMLKSRVISKLHKWQDEHIFQLLAISLNEIGDKMDSLGKEKYEQLLPLTRRIGCLFGHIERLTVGDKEAAVFSTELANRITNIIEQDTKEKIGGERTYLLDKAIYQWLLLLETKETSSHTRHDKGTKWEEPLLERQSAYGRKLNWHRSDTVRSYGGHIDF